MRRTTFLDFLTLWLENKQQELNRYAKSLEESLGGESKSTAGDKHDTGRAMIHLEQEKLAGQFNQLNSQIQLLAQIRQRPNPTTKVEIGSLFQLGDQYYFIGIPLGKISFQEQTVWCIGHQAPLAQQVLGKKRGETVLLNDKLPVISFID
jgi:hypothetical protein